MPKHAGGGLLLGPGTGTSDSILGVNANGVPITRVSTGEYVVNAAATARNRAELDAINSGRQVPANGGASAGAWNGGVDLSDRSVSAIAQAAATIALGMQSGVARSSDNVRATQGRVH